MVSLFAPAPPLTAKLTDLDTGMPLAGQVVVFQTGSTLLCTATTNAQGIAVCYNLFSPWLLLLNNGYTVSYAGDATHQPAIAYGGVVFF